MEKNNLLILVVSLTIGVILAGSILLPAVNDASDDIRGYAVYENPHNLAPYTEMKAGDHLYWSPTSITLNDEVIEGNRTGENWFKGETFLGADNMFFALKNDNTIAQVSGVLYVDLTVNEDLSVTYVYENQDTAGVAQTRTSAPMSWGFLIANEGDWCQVKYNSPQTTVYFNSLDEVYTSGPTGGLTSSKGTTAYYKGTAYDEGIIFNGVSEVARDVYSMTFSLSSMSYGEGLPTGDIRVIVVPASVESTPTPNAGADLIKVIPIMVILSLVIAATGALYLKRND